MPAPSPISVAPAYHRHRPEQTALYAIVAEYYPQFVQEIERSGGHLPQFVRREFEEYLKCGLLQHGFLRVKCDGCRHEHLVVFSCKRRGFCPSCGARRMVESAAHLVDHVFPEVPIRQRRLSRHGGLRACSQEALPACRLRVRFDLPISVALSVRSPTRSADPGAGGGATRHFDFSDPTLRPHRGRRGKDRRGYPDPAFRVGPEPQRPPAHAVPGRSLRLSRQAAHFSPCPPARPRRIKPTSEHTQPAHRARAGTARLADRRSGGTVPRLRARLQFRPPAGGFRDAQRLHSGTSWPAAKPYPRSRLRYRIAIGPHAGRKALTLSSIPPLDEVPHNPLLARSAGFSLHATTVCEAWQRSRLEHLCRYITRPAIATKRLSVDSRGRVAYQYKHAFRDGSTHVVLEPLDFMARLAVLVPRPRLNLTRFHGVFAPNFKYRPHIVPRRAPGRVDTDKPLAPMTWAQRLKRVFQIDIETCPDCGGRLQVIACIEDPPLIAKILAHVQRREILPASTARGPPVVAQT